MKKLYKKFLMPVAFSITPIFAIVSCAKQEQDSDPFSNIKIDFRNSIGTNPTPAPSPKPIIEPKIDPNNETKKETPKDNNLGGERLQDQDKENKPTDSGDSQEKTPQTKYPNETNGEKNIKDTEPEQPKQQTSNNSQFQINSINFDFNENDHTSLGVIVTLNKIPTEAEKMEFKLHINYPDGLDEEYDGIFNPNLWHTQYKDNKLFFELYDLAENFDYQILKIAYKDEVIKLPQESITFKAGTKPEDVQKTDSVENSNPPVKEIENNHDHDHGNNGSKNENIQPRQSNLNLEKVQFVADDSDETNVNGNLTLTLNQTITNFNSSKLEILFNLESFQYSELNFSLKNNVLNAYIYDLPKGQTITITSLKYNNESISLTESNKTFTTKAPETNTTSEDL